MVSDDTLVFTDTMVVDNALYGYRVQRLDPSGNDSDFSQTPAEVRSLPALPGAPNLESVTPESATEMRLEWSPPGDDVVSKYKIERRLSSSGVYTATTQVSGELTTMVDGGLTPATAYTYRLMAINEFGESAPSTELEGTTRSLSLSAPANVTATLQSDGRVLLDWQPGPDSAATVIEYSEGEMDGFRFLDSTGTGGPWGYYPGEGNTYQFRLKFVDGDSESPYSEAPIVFIPRRFPLYLPLIL